MLEDYLPGELFEEKEVEDGLLQIRELNSLQNKVGEKSYNLYFVTNISSMALTFQYKKISLDEYKTYFDLIVDRDTFDFVKEVINKRMVPTSPAEL